MGSTQSVYLANGSRYKVTVYDKSSPSQSVIIGIGDAIDVPITFENISVFLCDGKNTQAINANWKTKANKPDSGHMSIIITEEGCVELGYSDERAAKYWMWISRPNDIDHRPTKSFVANASGSIITVMNAAGAGECIIIHHRDTATIEYEDAIITCDDTKFPVKPKPRTSTIVFPDHTKVTGQLYGVNIEEEKWIVDGVNYKPDVTFFREL